MASLYRDKNSPFWYLKFKNPAGKWRCKSTRFRHGIATETRKATAMCAQYSLEEAQRSPQRDSWGSWVPEYLTRRYKNPNTIRRARNAWDRFLEYFAENNVTAPQDVTYRLCVDYMPWRTKRSAHNTALLELKILSVVCGEAVRRGIISNNPVRGLGIGRERGREKPELTDANITTIRQALKSEPDWMSHAFEIALHHGCRLSETSVFTTDVDVEANYIHFRRTKGDRPFTVPIHPAIQVRLRNLVKSAQKADRIFALPSSAAREFHRFFRKLSLLPSGVTFHCTRVTVASRLARSGYSIAKAMRLLNHGSELIHRQYQRLKVEDVADAYEFLQYPDTGLNEKKGSSRAKKARG